MDIMVLKLKSIIITLLFLFAAYTPAHATIYLNRNAEEGTVGTTVPISIFDQSDPPQLPYGGERATYQSSGGTPQGSKYYQWQTVNNQLDHLAALWLNNSTPITNIIGKTYYLAYFMRFDRINGLDIWHEFNDQSYDKLTDIMGSGVRWTFKVGQHTAPCYTTQNQDHRFTVGIGNSGYNFSGLECVDQLIQNSNGYSASNPIQLTYEAWHSVVVAIKMAFDSTGSAMLYINGTKVLEYNNIRTVADSSSTLTYIYMGGTLAQPAYDAPAHYRKFDAFLFTDNWQDIVDGGYLNGGGDNTPPPSSGDTSLSNGSTSGGSGCGFVKDDGKGQGAKGEGATLMILLVLALTVIVSLRKIKYFKGLLFLIIFLFPFSIANAADYYVATNGSDSNPGTEAQPWQHIAWATCGGSYLCPITTNNPNKLKGGDTLYIRGGTYNEYDIRFTNSGTATQLITIKNYPDEKPIIDGGFSNNLAGQSPMAVFHIDGKSYITLDGLEIMRGWRANIYLGDNTTTSNIIIQNCVLHDLNAYDNSGHVFFGNYISNITIKNNKMYKVILDPKASGTSGEGVFIGLGSGSYIIENNEMYNLINGVNLKYKQNDNNTPIVRNNLIHDIVFYGMTITSNYSIINNNIIYNSGYAGIKVYEESTGCSGVGGVGNVITHNTIVDNLNRGVVLNGPSACTGALDTILKDNLIYNFTSSEFRGLGVWIYLSVDNSNTTFDHNLIYSSSFSSPIRVLGNYYTTATAPLTGTGNIQQAPIFKDYANKDFTLMPNSPGYKAASDGYDMGADTSLPPTPAPDGGGGGNTPPPSSSSGGDSSASGGGGCGFVKDINGKGPMAKGEGLTFAMMLIITLAGVALAKKSLKIN